MASRKSKNPDQFRTPISDLAEIRKQEFASRFEAEFESCSDDLPADAVESHLNGVTAVALLQAFGWFGVDLDAALALIGEAAIRLRGDSSETIWTDEMNARRFALIDKEIQGTLTPAETVELAGLTKMLCDAVDIEENLPMKGAQALHAKLLQMGSEVKASD